MFKEMGVQSIGEAELIKLDKSLLNTKVGKYECSVTVGETLVMGLIFFGRSVPENVINVVCGSGIAEMTGLLRESLKLWNRDVDNEALRSVTSRGVADLIVNKDARTREDSLVKRLSLQSALTSFGVEFASHHLGFN